MRGTHNTPLPKQTRLGGGRGAPCTRTVAAHIQQNPGAKDQVTSHHRHFSLIGPSYIV